MRVFTFIAVLFILGCGPTADDKYIQGYHEGIAAGTAACSVDEIEIEVEPSPSPSASASPSPTPSPECKIYSEHNKKIVRCKKHKERD